MCKGSEAGKGVVCSWNLKMTMSENKWVPGKASLMGGWGERPESDDAAFVLNAVGSFWGYSAWKSNNPIYLLRSGLSSLICKMWVNKRLHREMQIKTTMREFHPGFPGCRWLSYRTGWEGRQKSIRRPSSGSWRRMTSWSAVSWNIRTKAGQMSASSTSMCYTEISFIWLPLQMPTQPVLQKQWNSLPVGCCEE